MGKTDFLDDKHLHYLFTYVQLLFALDKTIGLDVRDKLKYASYKQYCQKLTKQVNADSY